MTEDNDNLKVWHNEVLVGTITRNIEGIMAFKYDTGWLESGFPISQQLPLSSEKYLAENFKAHIFFSNLLPEAGAREHIIKQFKIPNTDFEFLKAIGGECAGAISILPSNIIPDQNKARYTILDDKSFEQLLLRRGAIIGELADNTRPRLSLAGAQDKCAVLFKENKYYLPQKDAPTSHILKFEVPNYKNIPIYEYFITQLAKQVGLVSANLELKNFAEHLFLVIERYDRVCSKTKGISRYHQEDFCQALGYRFENKYQQNNGPSFAECFNLLKNISTNPIRETERLLNWQIFNVIAGNSDAHAKNISLLYKDGEILLAPFYDLVCTRAIDKIDSKLAFAIGGEYEPLNLKQEHWHNFARDCNIKPKYLFELIRGMINKVEKHLPLLINDVNNTHGEHPELQRVVYVINKQIKKCRDSLRLAAK